MPELPEVEAVRLALDPHLSGARIDTVELRRESIRRPFPADFAERTAGQRITSLQRRGKYLLATLGSGDTLVMHLGMSGSFRVERDQHRELPGDFTYVRDTQAKHDHVIFHLSSGTRVVFNDPRRFGFMTVLAPDAIAHHSGLGTLGPEPLSRAFTAPRLARACAGRTVPLKVALLDQDIVAGLGNIYASEALHRARISPRRRARTLAYADGSPQPSAYALADAIRKVLRDAVRPDAPDFRVYGREGERCVRPSCRGTIRRIEQAGRSTFFCPACQRN